MKTAYDNVFLPSYESQSNFQRLTLRGNLENQIAWLTKQIATLVSYQHSKWEGYIVECEQALAHAEMRLMTATSNSAACMKALYLKAEIAYELTEWN
jgi:hypothetical protein